MPDKFPRAYVNDVKQDDSIMEYVNHGEFDRLGIGARPSGKPGSAKSQGMNLDHVSNRATGQK